MYLVIGVFTVVAILIIRQIAVLRDTWYKSKTIHVDNNFDSSRYSDRINEIGENAMGAVESGKVKKQLLLNNAQKHDSNEVLNKYTAFINQSMTYEYLISAKERKYNGED